MQATKKHSRDTRGNRQKKNIKDIVIEKLPEQKRHMNVVRVHLM